MNSTLYLGNWTCVPEGPQDVFTGRFSGIVSHTLTHRAGVVCQRVFFFLMVPMSLIVSHMTKHCQQHSICVQILTCSHKQNKFTASPSWHLHMSEKIPQMPGFFFLLSVCHFHISSRGWQLSAVYELRREKTIKGQDKHYCSYSFHIFYILTLHTLSASLISF